MYRYSFSSTGIIFIHRLFCSKWKFSSMGGNPVYKTILIYYLLAYYRQEDAQTRRLPYFSLGPHLTWYIWLRRYSRNEDAQA